MNIQLSNVIGDISGMTGMAILRAIVNGERNPRVSPGWRTNGFTQVARRLRKVWKETGGRNCCLRRAGTNSWNSPQSS
jgi:transposase